MFASMYQTLLNKPEIKAKNVFVASEAGIVTISRKNVSDMLTKLDQINDSSDNGNSCSVSKDNITDAIDLLSIADSHTEYFDDCASVENFDDTKSEVSSIGENQLVSATVDDPNLKKILNQINNLQCLFTWDIKPNNKNNVMLRIQNKYGEYNLNISSSEFTLERFIGNIIISYELFHKGEPELAQMKILEIGKWLEELDKGTDEFYLSISTGVQHVMKATFIHMLFATNLTEECKWLLDDIKSFAMMESKSRAAVHAIRAAILIEYGRSKTHFKKACEVAKKACDLDAKNSYWFYIHSLALTAQRYFLLTYKSIPAENEINAINQANSLSNGKNALFNYHKMILSKNTAEGNYHNSKNKNDKSMINKNIQDNKKVVHYIKQIISMDPKDPHLIIKCARILMTLPTRVRDFDLGKQYLTKAFLMAPNDVTVLKAIENAVQTYENGGISKKQKLKTAETIQNQHSLKIKTSKLENDLGVIVKKQKNGEDPVHNLTILVSKYDGLDKSKIIAQLCSYTILFTNNLRSGVEHFIKLIEQPEMINNDIITKHFSLFGSKIFNLSELICNEIRLATNLSGISSDDMLYYYKMLTKIMETCNLKIKDIDSSMKGKLIVNLPVQSSNTTVQSETESSDSESTDKIKPKKNHKKKKLQKTGPKVFTPNHELSKGPKINNARSKNNINTTEKVQNKKQQSKASDVNQMKEKIEKVVNSCNGEGVRFFNRPMENDGNLRTIRGDIHGYTQQLYQNILANTQPHFNLPNASSGDLNNYFNQNHARFYSPIQQSQFQYRNPTPLLSLRPQVSPQNTKPKPKTKTVPLVSKKK